MFMRPHPGIWNLQQCGVKEDMVQSAWERLVFQRSYSNEGVNKRTGEETL